MTRFSATPRQRVISGTGGNTTLTVLGRPKEENDLDLLAHSAASDLIKAKQYLQKTIAELQVQPTPHYVVVYADRYFLTGALSDYRRLMIIDVLVRTLNGLSGDVTLKIGSNVGRNDKDVWGSVGISTKPASKPYHNQVFDLSKGRTIRTGAIRIASDAVGSEQGVVTLIHEATHKYAGTWDYAYFDEDGRVPVDRLNTRDKATENADSFAWFVQRVGSWSG